jgi:hypothetical protein
MPRNLEDRSEAKPARPETIEKPKLLVVEGEDERRLLGVMLKRLGREDVQVIACRGKDDMPGVLESLPVRANFAQVDAVGIVRDAEVRSSSAFQSVRDAIVRGGLQAPPSPMTFSQGPPRIGILIVPPGKESGMLEDMCLESIAQDPALVCVDEFFRCIASKAGRTPRSPARSRVHAWLASQEAPYTRIGEAAEREWWPLDCPAFDSIREFLTAL